MPISVFSEIGPLKRVLVHRPGAELEQLTPLHLSRMLFDDIPYLRGAQQEHDTFARVLREEGAEVCYLKDMVAQSLRDPEIRGKFIDKFIGEAGPAARHERQALTRFFARFTETGKLVEKTMAGVKDVIGFIRRR